MAAAHLCLGVVATAVRVTASAPSLPNQDSSALYQQVLQLHSSPRAEPVNVVRDRLKAITGMSFSEEDFKSSSVPINDVPWQQMETDLGVLTQLQKALALMEEPVETFLLNTRERKAILRHKKAQGTSNPLDLSRHLRSLVPEWSAVANSIQLGFEISKFPQLTESPAVAVKDAMSTIAESASSFGVAVQWLMLAGIRRVQYLGDLGIEMVPAQMEVMNTIIGEFAGKKDAMLQTLRQSFEEAAVQMSIHIKDPITYLGEGPCLDASGYGYQTLESPGCESLLYCLQGCRSYDTKSCHGVNFEQSEPSCGRCLLRMERGFTAEKLPWVAIPWPNQGSGAVQASDSNSTFSNTTSFCYRRAIADWTQWPSQIRSLLDKDLTSLQHKYGGIARNWTRLMLKIDRAFWQVESSFFYVIPTKGEDD